MKYFFFTILFSHIFTFTQESFRYPEMIGETSFSHVQIPAGLSRQQWYEQLLEEQEQYLKEQLLQALGVSEQYFQQYIDDARIKIDYWDMCAQRDEESIVGYWKLVGRQCQRVEDESCSEWSVTESDIHEVKKSLEELGCCSRSFVMSLVQPTNNACSGSELIYIMPQFFRKDRLQRLAILCHELSHLKHKDYVWYVAVDDFLYDYCVADTVKVGQVLKIFKLFCERRADLEGFFRLKDTELFQTNIAGSNQYHGYPFQWYSFLGYRFEAPVDYIQDFMNGVKRDYLLHLAILKEMEIVLKG